MSKVLSEYDNITQTNVIVLKQFPPKLRRLAKFLLESNNPLTIKSACIELNLNYTSICSMIWKAKQKGNDFNKFVDEQAKSILHANKIGVYSSLLKGAVSDSSSSHNDRKLFLQLAGDLKESTNISVNVLTVGVNISALPNDTSRDKGIIDVEPFIPNDK